MYLMKHYREGDPKGWSTVLITALGIKHIFQQVTYILADYIYSSRYTANKERK